MPSNKNIICFGNNAFGQLGRGIDPSDKRDNTYTPYLFGCNKINDKGCKSSGSSPSPSSSKSKDINLDFNDVNDIQCGSQYTIVLKNDGNNN